MSESTIEKLEKLQKTSKVHGLLKDKLKIDNQVVSEFLVSLCGDSESMEDFGKKLNEKKAKIPHRVAEEIFEIVRGPKDEGNISKKRKRVESAQLSKSRKLESIPIVVDKVYKCRVTQIMSYGFFAELIEDLQGKSCIQGISGLCHISEICRKRISSPNVELKGRKVVFCKVLNISRERVKLSMKSIDQITGEDYDSDLRLQESQSKSDSIQKSALDKWEENQIRASGQANKVYNSDEDSDFDPQEEIDIERNETAPAFLRGYDLHQLDHEPANVCRVPDGSLMKAATKASELSKERRELREQQKLRLENNGEIPQDTKKDLLSSVPLKEKASNVIPEWKKYGLGAKGKITTQSIAEQRKNLPIFTMRKKLLEVIKNNQIVVIVGETGSGKTTQITQYLAEMGYCSGGKRIGCTQPRRVAAVSVAKRVAEEVGCQVGEDVGYSIRFEDKTSEKTRIKYMTDGMLLRECLSEGNLSQYSVIMLDEAHERQLHTDVLFGLLKKLSKDRKDLKVIITSATLDKEEFSKFFNNCPVFSIPGRTFPVEKLYAKNPEPDYLEASLETVMQIHLTEPPGDILVFLTGQEEIDTACQILFERMKSLGKDIPKLEILPIYSSLPSEMQSRIFEPAKPHTRKCVIATNIAETSVTIDGILYVVDPGFVKQNYYNPKTRMDRLTIVPISQAAAEQRAGRAGRTGPGKCYRLYTKESYEKELLPNTIPEIQRTNMGNVVLTLKAMGINDLLDFDFMDRPGTQALLGAMKELHNLGALDDDGLLTELGRRMSEFPLEPQMSKALLASIDLGCSAELITIVSMLSVQSVFFRPREKQQEADNRKSRFFHPSGDHLTYLKVYNSWKRHNRSQTWCFENYLQHRVLRRAHDVRQQLCGIFQRQKLPIVSDTSRNFTNVRKALTSGYFAQAAQRDPQEGYRTLAENNTVFIHPGSALHQKNPEWVIYHVLVETSKQYMRDMFQVDPKWLVELAPSYYKKQSPNSLSRRKKYEKINPLYSKYRANQDDWRLSYREKMIKKYQKPR